MWRKLFYSIKPPTKWRLPVVIAAGVFVGLGLFVIYVSRAYSYLSDEPTTCINCHVMAPQYVTWNHSSHREWTNCNDCHVPQDYVFNTYYFKAKDGLRHATIFTLRNEPQVIFIKDEGKEVVQQNCIRCHSSVLTDHRTLMKTNEYDKFRKERKCWDCHREVPHGRVNSLSSVPNARVPLPQSPVPEWLKNMMNKK